MLTCVEKLIDKKQGTRFKAKKGAIKKVQEADHKNKTIPTCTMCLNQNFDSMQLQVSAIDQTALALDHYKRNKLDRSCFRS